MKRVAALLAACAVGCAPLAPLRITHTPKQLAATSLEGSWEVVGSTFPMWLDGQKREPRFTYGPARRDGEHTRFDDTVSYLDAAGTKGSISGEDTQHPEVPTHFTWRGRGLLALFKSEWDLVFLSADGRWAIITFSPTLATPAGLDVIARAPGLDEAGWAEALAVIDAEPALRELAVGLQRLR